MLASPARLHGVDAREPLRQHGEGLPVTWLGRDSVPAVLERFPDAKVVATPGVAAHMDAQWSP